MHIRWEDGSINAIQLYPWIHSVICLAYLNTFPSIFVRLETLLMEQCRRRRRRHVENWIYDNFRCGENAQVTKYLIKIFFVIGMGMKCKKCAQFRAKLCLFQLNWREYSCYCKCINLAFESVERLRKKAHELKWDGMDKCVDQLWHTQSMSAGMHWNV